MVPENSLLFQVAVFRTLIFKPLVAHSDDVGHRLWDTQSTLYVPATASAAIRECPWTKTSAFANDGTIIANVSGRHTVANRPLPRSKTLFH